MVRDNPGQGASLLVQVSIRAWSHSDVAVTDASGRVAASKPGSIQYLLSSDCDVREGLQMDRMFTTGTNDA